MPLRKQTRREDPKPLREELISLDNDRSLALGLFCILCISEGIGIYANRTGSTGTINLKIYDGDEQWQDSIAKSENLDEVVEGYCRILKLTDKYQALKDTFVARLAERPAEGRQAGSPTQTPTKAPAGPTRAS